MTHKRYFHMGAESKAQSPLWNTERSRTSIHVLMHVLLPDIIAQQKILCLTVSGSQRLRDFHI